MSPVADCPQLNYHALCGPRIIAFVAVVSPRRLARLMGNRLYRRITLKGAKMDNRYHRVAAILLSGALSAAAVASDLAATPAPRVALLELFTSEGCNSCPPTDRWVSALPRPRLVPEKLVVLAFHVDYWNYLGWPDRFSQALFTQRQQARVRSNGLRTAYTPQLLLNGRDYRERGDIDAQVARVQGQAARIQLLLNNERKGADVKAKVFIQPLATAPSEPMELYLAVYENNLETQVKTGENRGQRLRHDYVVRSLIGPIAVATHQATRWETPIALQAQWKIENLGLAAFVQSTGSGEVLQATAQPLRNREF